MSEVQIFGGTSSAVVLLTYCSMAVIAVLGIFIVLYLVSRNSKKNENLLEELVLDERQDNRDGYTSVVDKSRFMGKEGVCVTDLRPAGTINVDGEPLDVVTEGNFISAGEKVKIINVDGSRVLVRQI
ncbi:MAG: NfeD family protein [Selenomonadaceae bacterium]|nr:NfeD family protein [Selenomonadaceae bacterium]